MPVLSAVSAIAFRIARWTYRGVRAIGESKGRPIHWTRTFRSLSSATRPNSRSCRPRMWRTSGRGRCQFSVENPNTVSQPMLRRTAVRAPAGRGSPRPRCDPRCAGVRGERPQRPLPSMMHATWRGAAAAVCDSEGSDGTRFHVSQPAPTGRGVEECRRGTVVREHESSRQHGRRPRRTRRRRTPRRRPLPRAVAIPPANCCVTSWSSAARCATGTNWATDRWDERVERLGAIADRAGASFLTLRAYEPGADPVDLEWWQRVVGSCHVIVDPCGDGRQRFAEAMQRLHPDEPVNEATVAEALYAPADCEPDLIVVLGESTRLPPSLVWDWPTANWSSTRWPGTSCHPTTCWRRLPTCRQRRFGGLDDDA
jgi:hypothetical protein